MKPIQPKPTVYKGTRFRSRLEARWAVFLDYHPDVIDWEYEPKMFLSPQGWTYTPDFWVKTVSGFYLEIKPSLPSKDYMSWLRYYQFDYPLLIGYGDFQSGLYIYANPSLADLFRPNKQALQQAYSYRFDLEKPYGRRPPPKRSRVSRPLQGTDRPVRRRRKSKGRGRKR